MITVGVVINEQVQFSIECIKSILKNSYEVTKLIVIKNGLEDEALDSFLDAASIGTNVNLQVLKFERIQSYSRACNEIVEQTETEYVCFVHNDTIVTNNCFSKLVGVLKENKKAFTVLPLTSYSNEHFCCMDSIREKFEKIKPNNKNEITSHKLEDLFKELYGNIEEFSLIVEQLNNMQSTAHEDISSYCQIFRTSSLRTFKFNEIFTARGFEDKELLVRFLRYDYKVYLCKYAFVHHHGNLTTDGVGKDYIEEFNKQKKIYYKIVKEVHNNRIESLYNIPGNKSDDLFVAGSNKKILFFNSNYLPENAGGSELSAHKTNLDLIKMGYEVTAVCCFDRQYKPFKEENTLTYEGIKVIQVKLDEIDERIKDIITEEKPSVIYAFSFHSRRILELRSNIPMIFHFRHQSDLLHSNLLTILREKDIKLVSNSRWMKNLLDNCTGKESKLVYPIIHPNDCTIEMGERQEIVLGNCIHSKGIFDLLSLCDMLKNRQFVGYGNLDPTISVEDLPQNFEYRGWKDDIKEIYQNAKVVINLSIDREPFGRTLIESMTNKIPVVARDEGGPLEIVDKGGILCHDLPDFAKALDSIFTDEKLYEQLVAGTQEDLKWYNPYKENSKMIKILTDSIKKERQAEYV